jgi:arylformamidase
MVFDIDFARYKLVDLSLEVIPNQTVPGRPFEVREGRLGDGTRKFDIVNTHTHVGTHVESPWHFRGEGKTCSDFGLDKFMGRATLLRGVLPTGENEVPVEYVREQLEPRRGTFKILLVRNDTQARPLRFRRGCVDYFAALGLNMFAFDSTIEFGQGQADGERFHELMLGALTLLAEFPDNTQALDRDDFYLFAAPLKIRDIDSSACRMFAIVEK